MSQGPIKGNRGMLGRLRRSEKGAAMVEYAVTMALFFLLFFALLDFGRLMYNWVTTEKAMQMAARKAVVRPAICEEVPSSNNRGSASTAEDRYGTPCGEDGSNMCAGESLPTIAWPPNLAAGEVCTVDAEYDTVAEIWDEIKALMPAGAKPENLKITYTFDPELNFLGGPYVPMVTVEVQDLTFEFISPLLGLGNLAAGQATAGATTFNDIPFPSMSVSLPGEDLALGVGG